MATGDQADIVSRIKGVLPGGWFPPPAAPGAPSDSPILDGLLAGPAAMFSWAYGLIQYWAQQTRIATATDVNLDIIALDYLGPDFSRAPNEPDAQFAARIRAAIFQGKQTRAAITAAVQGLGLPAPALFEPTNPGDTGAYGYGNLGYCAAGGYGSMELPCQLFVTAYRQVVGGVANIGGYGSQSMTDLTDQNGSVLTDQNGNPLVVVTVGATYAPGGYGVGAIAYATIEQAGTQLEDGQIYETIAGAVAAGVVAWTRIENAPLFATPSDFSADFSSDFQ